LALLVTADLKVLAALDGQLLAVLALGALHTQHNLLGRLGLRAITHEETSLHRPVSPAFPCSNPTHASIWRRLTLGVQRVLALLVLCHLVKGVLLALPLAKSPPLFRHVHLEETHTHA
ncbi:unnamed protein product, partial [Ixodes hexagonus]